MRPVHAAAAAAILIVMTAAIVTGGHRIAAPADEIVIAPEDMPDASEAGLSEDTSDAADATGTVVTEEPTSPPVQSRAIDPETIAPPPVSDAPLERAEPRPPLSELSLALPPKPKTPDQWKGTPLFQPLATAAGVFQAMGHTVALSGVEAVLPDETCTDEAGEQWPCGMRARGAFRSFLRGRAPVCAVPPENERDTIVATCHIGKQDLGAWLVANGWARAAAGGPYAKAEAIARKEKMGIFGTAPNLSGLPPTPASIEPSSPEPPDPSTSILDLSGDVGATPIPPPAPAE